MICSVSVPWQTLSFNPVRYGEMKGGPVGEVYDCQARWPLQVFLEYDDGRVFAALSFQSQLCSLRWEISHKIRSVSRSLSENVSEVPLWDKTERKGPKI